MRKSIVLLLAAGILGVSCVKVDNSLGKGLVDKGLIFDTYMEEFPLEQIKLKLSEDLSGYSDTHLTIGAIRDEAFGLTTRSAAFPLLPQLDSLDFGTDPVAVSFDLYFEADSISCADDSQKGIIQNIYVYELTEKLSRDEVAATTEVKHGSQRITEGLPVYDGSGPLNFYFSQAFAQKYVEEISKMGTGALNYDTYVSALPGICIETDKPSGYGGRINLFNFSCLSVSNNYYYRNNNIAVLRVNSLWKDEKERKDSSFIFVPGEPEFLDEVTAISNNKKFYQYCFNHTSHSTMEEDAKNKIRVEGGTGLKPVISAKELRDKTRAAIIANGGNPDEAIIVKATIELPYEQPANYMDMKYFPTILSPTIRVILSDEEGKDYATFAGLTDASISSEDQGDINRSTLMYCPDITYHLQQILAREDLDTETDADIWLLTIHTRKVAEANGSLYDDSYYQNLLYANYYNSIYGGGYGSYSGYGGYNNYGYSNYYNYMMLAQMMAASTEQSYTYTQELDKDRYYKAVLNGPQSASRKPLFRVTYAFPGK